MLEGKKEGELMVMLRRAPIGVGGRQSREERGRKKQRHEEKNWQSSEFLALHWRRGAAGYGSYPGLWCSWGLGFKALMGFEKGAVWEEGSLDIFFFFFPFPFFPFFEFSSSLFLSSSFLSDFFSFFSKIKIKKMEEKE